MFTAKINNNDYIREENIDIFFEKIERYKERLIILDIHHNNLVFFPDEFLSNNINLQKLYIFSGISTTLPDKFLSKNINLQKLDISHNLKSLPDDFLSNNINLQELDISLNNLTSLPDNFLSNNINLQELNIHHNNLISLPDNFLSNNINLKELDISLNKLTSLPNKFLFNNTKLQDLYFTSYNQNSLFSFDKMFKAIRVNTRLQKELDFVNKYKNVNTLTNFIFLLNNLYIAEDLINIKDWLSFYIYL